MKYLPIFLDLDDRHVVVVGGGEKAAQKLRLLARTGARITVVAETVSQEIARLAADGRIAIAARRFAAADLDGASIAFAASDDPAADHAVAAAATARGIAINVVDGPEASSFIMPAIVDRAPVIVAIGTEGAAPILARQIKSRIEAWLPANYGRLAEAALALRSRIRAEVGGPEPRRRVWERLLGGAFRTRVLAGDAAGAAHAADTEIAAVGRDLGRPGTVSLIGCGPGDPELLTLKAQQRLQQADVLVVDRLVNPAILEYARRDAERIEVGKTPGGASASQESINRILVREALKGRHVARLKGGDPFVFGRAAEEMIAVRAAGIEVEVVPGVTAAHACAASIGLPLTLRRRIRQFTVLTGGVADGPLDHDWAALSRPGQAFAVYMGVRSAPVVAERLLAAGARPDTPVVVVENGTLPEERAMVTTLAALPETIESKDIRGPAVLFVGLDWADAYLTRPAKVEVVHPVHPVHQPEPAIGEPRPDPARDASGRTWTPAEIALATFWVAG